MRLSGKICVVTGAAQGIGAGIVRAFAAEGAHVVAVDLDGAGAAAIAAEVGGDHMAMDVSDEAGWEALAKAHPAIDVMVNNAGITGFEAGFAAHDPEKASLAEWRAVHAVNLDGTFMGCRYAIGAMRARGAGSIINMSSRSGMVGIPGAAAYASSKAGIRNHSKTVALYCAQEGLNIRCNSIHPGAILTPMWEAMLGTGEGRAEREAGFVKDTPQKRFGRVEEVAALAVLLASDEAAYMTGTELTIDGGLLAGSAASPSAAED
ncbi:SDR family oxidoreductase [Alphaproteobacteria bacterium KMM 3653]|uniref:SDR family oxidoreductase n=1 Tax=Harenicola maris TaxID=2841044 RepID=A0AAP2G5F6_9RHOB|nr:SDR family oxidoreductase [Harenicola maris]